LAGLESHTVVEQPIAFIWRAERTDIIDHGQSGRSQWEGKLHELPGWICGVCNWSRIGIDWIVVAWTI